LRTFIYVERTSAFGRPFLHLARTDVETSELILDGFGASIPLFKEIATTGQDEYGNTIIDQSIRTDYKREAGVPTEVALSSTTDYVTRTFAETRDVNDWLISRPKTITLGSSPRCLNANDCTERDKHRQTTLTYLPGTDLPQTITRESTDVSLQVTTELEHDARGNVTRW
jgi:hypothetical protein